MSHVSTVEKVVEHKGPGTRFAAVVWLALTIFVLCVPCPLAQPRGGLGAAERWGVGARLLASAGVLRGAGKTALVASNIPVLAFGRQDGRFTVDLGAGLALLSEHRYAQQDFGGPLQFALTFGVGVPLYQRVGVGYRFLHYSDAGAHGSDTIGADFHMVELIYRF